MSLRRYHLGCGVWTHKAWVGSLFSRNAKPAQFLNQYGDTFNAVEGNSTFYGLPSESTLLKWRSNTRDGFQFCFKFPRKISHQTRLIDPKPHLEHLFSTLEPIYDRMGPLFLQLPPDFGPDQIPDLDRFLDLLPDDFNYSVEVRHQDFYVKRQDIALSRTLARHNASRVILDNRFASNFPASAKTISIHHIGKHPILRYVGHFEPSMNQDLLTRWSDVVAGWISEGCLPYIFFHTHNDDAAPELARLFHDLLSEKVEVGELPESPEDQLTLSFQQHASV